MLEVPDDASRNILDSFYISLLLTLLYLQEALCEKLKLYSRYEKYL